MKRHYDVHGVHVNVEVSEHRLLRPVEAMLGPFAASDAGERPFLCRLRPGTAPDAPPPEAGMRKFWEGRLPVGIHVAAYTSGDQRYICVPGKAWLRMDLAARSALIVARPGELRALGDACLISMVCEMLAQAGHHVLHAACLTTGRGAQRRAVLICGRSGCGKTTTSLALAGQGMGLLTDDASFVTLREGRPLVWGMPRTLKVHERTFELLPWLRELPRRPIPAEGEYGLPPQHLLDGHHMEEFRPGLVLFLEPHNEREHRLEPLSPLEAIERLTAENVRALDPRASGPAGGAFQAFGALVRESELRALSVGPPQQDLAGLLAPLLVGAGP